MNGWERASRHGGSTCRPIPTPKSNLSTVRVHVSAHAAEGEERERLWARTGRDRQEPRRLCRTSLHRDRCRGLRATCREVGEIRTRHLRPDPGRRVRLAPGKVRAVRGQPVGREVVTADGHVLDVSDHDNADLFWALRGGGGNFGVVTSFTYRLHPVTTVLGGSLAFPLTNAAAVIDAYRRLAKEAPDELGVQCGLLSPDRSTKVAAIVVCHCGDLDQAEADIQSVRQLGTPLVDAIGPQVLRRSEPPDRRELPPRRAELLEVRLLHRPVRRRRPDADRPVRTVPVTHDVLRPRIDGRRRDLTRRIDSHRLPPPRTGPQPPDPQPMGRPRRHGAEHRMDPRYIRSPSTPHGQPSLRQLPLRRRTLATPETPTAPTTSDSSN